ncbi:MAG: ABC transporter permease [Oscillospiraceae bacterium]|nr:ABC transporter permease [Oscillospiraceae bacterium]
MSLILANFLAASMRMATPLLIAALGLIISERAGLMNISAEGAMLAAAFAAYAITAATGNNIWLGLVAAIFAGMLVAGIFAYTSIHLKVKQVVVGAGINMLCTGMTGFLFRRLFRGEDAIVSSMTVSTFQNYNIPLLSDIPFLNELFFKHTFFTYFAFIMVAVTWVVIKKTSLGIKIISVGENPRAADSLGVNVIALRYAATLYSGVMFGIAGAYLSIVQGGIFTENMTAGRGFIAMAVVVLGKWHPGGAFLGALLFGASNALQMLLQNSGNNTLGNLILGIPYAATIIAVILVSRSRTAAPSALGTPYVKS